MLHAKTNTKTKTVRTTIKTKTMATTLLLTFALTMGLGSAPAWAATDATAGRKPNTFTIEEMQKAAVSNNRQSKQIQLGLTAINNGLDELYNGKVDISHGYSSLNSKQAEAGQSVADLQQKIDGLKLQLQANPKDVALASVIAMLESQRDSMMGSVGSSIGSNYASLQNQTKELEQKEDDAKNAKKDLLTQQKDAAAQIAYNVGKTALGALELEANIDLAKKGSQLKIDLQKIGELRQSLGLGISTDVQEKTIDVAAAAKSIKDAEAQLASVKEGLNDAMGRDLHAELYIAPFTPPAQATPAPGYSAQLVEQLTKDSGKLATIDYNVQNLRTKYNKTADPAEERTLENDMAKEELKIAEQKVAIQTTVKSKIDAIDTTGKAYTQAIMAYDKEVQTNKWAKQKLDLGLISPIEYKGSELSLQQLEMQKRSAAYKHYLAQEDYNLTKQGIGL